MNQRKEVTIDTSASSRHHRSRELPQTGNVCGIATVFVVEEPEIPRRAVRDACKIFRPRGVEAPLFAQSGEDVQAAASEVVQEIRQLRRPIFKFADFCAICS